MSNKLSKKLQEWLDENEVFKGKFIGYKLERGGLGISRIDDDWWECEDYLIRFEDLAPIFESELKKARVDVLNEIQDYLRIDATNHVCVNAKIIYKYIEKLIDQNKIDDEEK